MKRFVHQYKPTGMYATMRSHGLAYDGTLQEAKVYRNKNGGHVYVNGRRPPEEFEWVPVELTVVPTEVYSHPDGGRYRILQKGASLKHPDTGEWFDAVIYQDIACGEVCVTDVSRWRARFKLEGEGA